LLDPDGKVSPVLATWATTDLGKITRISPAVGGGIAFNNKGQIALIVRIDGGLDTLVLLSPTTP
jgi:hypothetical protein